MSVDREVVWWIQEVRASARCGFWYGVSSVGCVTIHHGVCDGVVCVISTVFVMCVKERLYFSKSSSVEFLKLAFPNM